MQSSLNELVGVLERMPDADFRKAVEVFRREEERRHRAAALAFREGDRVGFLARDGRRVSGVVDKVNLRTVTICSGDGTHWRVAPQLLEPEADQSAVRTEGTE